MPPRRRRSRPRPVLWRAYRSRFAVVRRFACATYIVATARAASVIASVFSRCINASTIAPAQSRSSKLGAPSLPAQCRRASPSLAASRATTALRLSSAAHNTTVASRAASRSARVPFVVVRSSVFPATTSRTYDAGELSRSKPSISFDLRSPQSSTRSRPIRFITAIASSGSRTGMMPAAPLSSAVAIVEVARKTSIHHGDGGGGARRRGRGGRRDVERAYHEMIVLMLPDSICETRTRNR